ncbi:MAG: hypothetical protein ACOCUS_00965 [Polyangiales bacterium]
MLRTAGRWVALAVLVAAGCGGRSSVELVVDLRSDFEPGEEVAGARVVLQRTGSDAEGPADGRMADRLLAMDDDLIGGLRIAELDGLDKGDYALTVSLLDSTGRTVADRRVLFRLERSRVITVLVSRACGELECPQPGDDPDHVACQGGRCVDPRCSPDTPEFCDEPGCETDSDCGGGACVVAQCIDGECFEMPGAGGTETDCTDGVDNDCDGDIDCADDDCLGAACDDGNACTEDDVCTEEGSCGGSMVDCDDGNPCTDDSCDPVEGCVSTPNSAGCDDGLFCNGMDSCSDGTCSVHAGDPCTGATVCDEDMDACVGCVDDGDCPDAMVGSWGTCGGFSGTCDETGTQSRTITEFTCDGGECNSSTRDETRDCSRDTDDTTCGSTTCGGWGTCGSFSGTCDEVGSQGRTCTDRRCSGGSCTDMDRTETRTCSRADRDGVQCGSNGWIMCCDQSCIDTRNNPSHCGSCFVDCDAQGLPCAYTGSSWPGTDSYACRDCSSNSQCESILASGATCWDISSPPAFCQCQGNEDCPTGQVCNEVSGHNYCSY